MTGIRWLPSGVVEHSLPAPKGLIHCDHVLDVGACMRPMQWYKPKRHVCLEPYGPYADVLERAGYEVVRGSAQDMLASMRAEAVYLLDVIEHMSREDALDVIDTALRVASRQVVIYTPNGFMVHDKDPWEMGGDVWQLHRSGWLPEEFPGWTTYLYGKRPYEGFYAIKNTGSVA